MKTLQSELNRAGLVKNNRSSISKNLDESNLDTLLIDNVICSEIANYCRSIRKPIKEKFKLFNPSEKMAKCV